MTNFSPAFDTAKQRLRQAVHDTHDFYGWKFCLVRQDDLYELLGAVAAYAKTMDVIGRLDASSGAMEDVCEGLDRRATDCREMANKARAGKDRNDHLRLDGKAQAYGHAAELVRAAAFSPQSEKDA